jgi:ABC-type branched-subunit amino acid transport system substrate-binding protein
LPRTGPEKAITDSIVNALRQALEDRGNNVLGRPVTYVDLDNASRTKGEWDPALDVQNADQAVSKLGAVAYIGPLDFGSAKVSIPVTDAANLVMVSPGATYPGLTRAVAGVTEPNEPDVYYLFSGAATMRNFARVVPIDDGRFKKQYPGDAPPPEVLGRTEIGTWVAKLGLKGTHWYQSYKDRFGSEPDVHALFGYEAMNVVLDGITRAGSVDRRAVRDAVMETRNYDGVLGTWSFDANGDITGLSAPTPLPH